MLWISTWLRAGCAVAVLTALLVLTPNANDPVPTDLATERTQPAYPPVRLAHEPPSLHRFDVLPQRLKVGTSPR